jgi:hypothetical protein
MSSLLTVSYKTKSKTRPHKGKYASNDSEKNIGWLQYMVETGHYGNTCCSFTPITFDATLKRPKMNVSESHIRKIIHCSRKMVVLELDLIYKNEAHGNILLVNKNVIPWEIERFEPHGSDKIVYIISMFDKEWKRLQKVLDSSLEAFFKDAMKDIPFVYKSPNETCPFLGPQVRGEFLQRKTGLCQIWTFFYLDARIENPHATAEEVLRSLGTLSRNDLYELIQDYLSYVQENPVADRYLSFHKARYLLVEIYDKIMRGVRRNADADADADLLSFVLFQVIDGTRDAETCDSLYYIFETLNDILFTKEDSLSFVLQTAKELVGKWIPDRSAISEKLYKFLHAKR